MPNKRADLTPEVEDKIIADYLDGHKTTVICLEYKIAPATLYRILHNHNVKLREGAKPRKASLPSSEKPTKHLRVPVVKKLLQLTHEEVTYFKQQMDDKVLQYGQGSEVDAHCEVWIEYTDELVTRLEQWIEALDDDTSGVALGLVAFKESLAAIRKLEPPEKEGEAHA